MKLELRDVSCGYAADRPILKHVSMELSDGDICCILGPNGVGKTTLFKTILSLLPPLEGQVCIDGEQVAKWPAKKRAQYMAYVAQAHIPAFPYRVREVVMMGRLGQTGAFSQPTRKDYEIAEQALETVGIRHLRDRVYTDISGGERQLLMIARALAQQPKILVMDEPTANLDYGNMVTALKCITDLARQGLCIIFTSHMPDQAFMCRAKTVLLSRGEPMQFGPCDKVITERSLCRAYGTDIRILEVLSPNGSPIKVVAPGFIDQ